MTWEYIAGFFDGEGCITLYDYERKRKKAGIAIDYINNKQWHKHTKHETGWHHVKT